MLPEEIEREWRSPENWRWGIYTSRLDPRIIVPKQRRYAGWTLNFGHVKAWPVLIGEIAAFLVPTILLVQFNLITPLRIILLICSYIALVSAHCIWEASIRYRIK